MLCVILYCRRPHPNRTWLAIGADKNRNFNKLHHRSSPRRHIAPRVFVLMLQWRGVHKGQIPTELGMLTALKELVLADGDAFLGEGALTGESPV